MCVCVSCSDASDIHRGAGAADRFGTVADVPDEIQRKLQGAGGGNCPNAAKTTAGCDR